MKTKEIKISPFNPRKMGKEARQALKASIKEFSDISGITINSKTGNIVSGNHRWEELQAKHKDLELQNVFEDRYAIMSGGKFTGFMARVVNWSLNKEKQANITANSTNVMGEWSSGLQDVLRDISAETEEALLKELRLSDMMVDLMVTDDDLDLDTADTKRENTQNSEDKKSKKDNDYGLEDDENHHSEVREIISTIKITLPSEHKEEAIEAILGVLHKLPWYDKITIN